ncbi:MAG: pyridoxal-phosphate dependent enzyme [Cytophagaceae bacterium]|nr:pyridoxal-phosphate dependent enzyme [Cytophagaceae bacterium]
MISTPEPKLGLDRWEFLEKFAKQNFNVDCKVHAFRNDEHYATGSFKDPGAMLAASVLKEAGRNEYIVASTGNVANAFAYYMAKAGVSLSAFIPQDALALNSAGVSCYGEKVFRVKGDYALAKKVAADYAAKYGILMTGGNTDPLRVEAKRTQVFDWLRYLPQFPTMYIQALSGGTGPISIEKAFREMKELDLIKQLPRFVLIQPDGCSPMLQAWQQAKKAGFPEGWKTKYPIIENPVTKVPTLATGNPGSYPIIADLTKKSEGEMLEIEEEKLVDITRWVAYEAVVAIGPAAATAVLGFVQALKEKQVKNGEVILLNVGEGISRAPELLHEMNYTEENVASVEECKRFDRAALKEQLLKKVLA